MGSQEKETELKNIIDKSPLLATILAKDCLPESQRVPLLKRAFLESGTRFEEKIHGRLDDKIFMPAVLTGISMGIVPAKPYERMLAAAAVVFLIGYEIGSAEEIERVMPELIFPLATNLGAINLDFLKTPEEIKLTQAFYLGLGLAGVTYKMQFTPRSQLPSPFEDLFN